MALHGPGLTEPAAEPERLQPDTQSLTVPEMAWIALVIPTPGSSYYPCCTLPAKEVPPLEAT